MKHKILAIFITSLLLFGMLGCKPMTAEPPETTTAVPHTAPGTVPSATVPPATAAAMLTREEAQAIALKHAGFTADQVTRLRAEYDFDDGIPEYEVDFRVGNWEYDYTIHAETGQILKSEKELDD